MWKKILINFFRLVLALTLIFSGFVKAIDPKGTQYKLQEYLAALHLEAGSAEAVVLVIAVFLAAIEFCLGIFLLFAIRRRLVSSLTLALMIVMTLVTCWVYIAHPVSDCGCFGDAIKLSPGGTLLKNIGLTICAAAVATMPKSMIRFISEMNQWIVSYYTALFIFTCSLMSLYYLPIFDFRPYKIGANIKEGMKIPEGAELPEFETTFILEKNDEQKEFTIDNYPDSTWTFVDSKTTLKKEGYVPPIHDFSISLEGVDITEDILDNPGYTFLLISPHLEHADDTNFGDINQVYEYARTNNYIFLCLTASSKGAIEHWKEYTGAEYVFASTDETTLKTIIRSNPGMLLLKNGTIIRKWAIANLPDINADTLPLHQVEIGKQPEGSTPRKILKIILWYILPLLLLTIADRAWAWTRWLKEKKRLTKQSK